MVCLLAPWFLLGEKIRRGAGLFPVLVADGGCGQLQRWQGVKCPGTMCGLRDSQAAAWYGTCRAGGQMLGPLLSGWGGISWL